MATMKPHADRSLPALFHGWRALLPGVLLTGVIAGAAFLLQGLPGLGMFGPLIIAILIGMVFHNVIGTPAAALPGVGFAMKRVLRAGIVLLGLQLTFQQILSVGGPGFAVVAVSLLATFLFTTWLGRALGVDAGLTQLIAAGSSICGASAVIATNTVTRARDEDVTYAVACVTVFGTLSMLLMPMIGGALDLGARTYGLWTGASIHEIAQVVAAAFARGQEAGDFGTIAKLARVMLLAPLVLSLGALAAWRLRAKGDETRAAAPVPWFVLGFVGMVAVASTGMIPESALSFGNGLTRFLLAMALAAMGLATDVGKLRAAGLRPAALGAGAWIFISIFSFGLLKVMA